MSFFVDFHSFFILKWQTFMLTISMFIRILIHSSKKKKVKNSVYMDFFSFLCTLFNSKN